MANKGLKEYTKQITQTIGDVAKVSVNINKEDANMHMIIPLFQTLGPNPIDLSLIFNYQDINVKREFGKGCNLSTFKDIRAYSSTIDVIDADGSTTTYTLDKNETYYSKESSLKISKGSVYISSDGDYDTFSIEDQQGNSLYFDEKYTYYPSKIRYKNGFEVSLNNGPNMDNYLGAKVEFTKTNNMYSRVTYKQNEALMCYVKFGYDNNQRLTSVEHYKEKDTELIKKLSITYNTNVIIVKDEISKDYAKYNFTNNRVSQIIEGVNNNSKVLTKITYEEHKTTLKDQYGKEVYYYFDENQLPYLAIDDKGYASFMKYDSETKKMVAQSNVISTKKKRENICNITLDNFTKESGITLATASITDAVFEDIVSDAYTVSGTGSLTYAFQTTDLGGEAITAILFCKIVNQNGGFAKFSLKIDGEDSQEFRTDINGQYEMIVLEQKPIKSFDTVTLEILSSDCELEIGGIQLLNGSYKISYAYDSNRNLIKIDKDGKVRHSSYNASGRLGASSDSSLVSYEYDEYGNMKKARLGFGGTLKNNYDEYNNLVEQKISDETNYKVFSTSKVYDNGRFVTSQKDELGKETTYQYDKFGRIKKVIDALEIAHEYDYNEFDQIKEIRLDYKKIAGYEYDSLQRLTKITLNNGSIYSFAYDTKNNLNKVSLNGQVLVSYTYNTNDLVECMTYGSTGDKYTFKYNSKDNVESITLNDENKPRYQYIYDDFDQLTQVQDESGKLIRSYEYDSKGKVKKIQSGNASITYDIEETKRVVEGHTIYESFDSLSKSKSLGLEGLISGIESTEVFAGSMFLKDATLRSGKYILSPLQSSDPSAPFNYNFVIKDLIPCISFTSNNPLIYSPVAIDDRYTDRGCIGFWFYAKDTPQDTIKYKTLLQIRGKDCKNQILIKANSDRVTLEIYDESQNQKAFVATSTKIIMNQWNFISLNFYYRDDGAGYSKVQSYMLQLNDEIKEKTAEIEMSFLSGATYHIGHTMNSANQIVDLMNTYFTGLILGLRKNITTQEMKDYYSFSKDYILRPAYEDYNSIYHSSVSTHNLTTKNIEWFDIYPLQHHPNSIKGKKPIAFDIREKEGHDLTFGYNLKSKRYAYMADEGRLEYSLDMPYNGTIMMRAFIKEEADKRYLFECKDSKQKFGLFILDNYVYLECNGTSYNTNLKFESNKWHTVGLSYNIAAVTDSVTPVKIVSMRVYVDGKTYTLNVSLDYFGNLRLSIGRKIDPVTINYSDGYKTYSYQPLCGQIEMLATRATYCEVTTLNELSNELKDTTKVREYDGFVRLSKLELNESDVNILSHEYIYTSKKEASSSIENLSHQISQEKISMGGKYPISRSYQIDALGNVTKITDGTFGTHTYEYNNRGFLTKEDSTVYSYDDNGNILKAGTTSFSYDSTIKDRLNKVNNDTIYYSSINPLNPLGYKNNSYTFEGRRLVKVKKDYVSSYDEITYEYNDEGLRTAKYIYHGFYDDTEEYGEDYKYYYEQDKLITEIGPDARLDFLYDENGELYGFVKDTKDKYFYVRDYMKNILGIIDNKGNLVVKYTYTAYGKYDIYEDYNLGNINPFKYKGYYYDRETGLYLVTTRYYNPEWCRFISPDSIEYLDPSSINGMNLYAYCGNDPVNKIDPTGHFAISTFLISLAIGALVSWGLSEAFGSQIAGGIGSVAGGGTAISTGISLCAFGPWGITAGIALMVIGAGTIAFGANEIVAGATGTNYIQQWTGWNNDLYNGLYIGLNIASAVGSIAGNIGMRFASTAKLNAVMKNPELIQNYSKFQFKTYARYSNQWTLLPSKNGKGMRALSLVNNGNSIRYGYGINNAEHYFGEYYWIVANGFGKFRFPFI